MRGRRCRYWPGASAFPGSTPACTIPGRDRRCAQPAQPSPPRPVQALAGGQQGAGRGLRPVFTRIQTLVSGDGDGLTFVVNSSAGSALAGPPAEEISEALPKARVFVVDEPEEWEAAFKEAGSAKAIGIAGGDGSINSAAEVAMANNQPLAIVPAGTLNHLARDLGIDSVDGDHRGHQRRQGRSYRRGHHRRQAVPQHRQLRQLRRAGRRPRAPRGPHRQVAGRPRRPGEGAAPTSSRSRSRSTAGAGRCG